MEDPKRQLNMEEKKNLQRLLFSDITTASTKYKATRDKERAQLQNQLIEKAPAALRALLAQWKKARDTQSRMEKQLNGSGYAIETYPTPALKIYYGKPPKPLLAFDEETRRTEKKILDLKRDFTLRLFAGGEEARGLFVSLSGELTKIQRN
jgi:hypothetical protein